MLVGVPGDITHGVRILGCEVKALKLPGLDSCSGRYPADFVAVYLHIPARHSLVLLEFSSCGYAQIDLHGGSVFFGRHF
ncbi:hypothetical protein D3C75_1298400 [compost metagenome]